MSTEKGEAEVAMPGKALHITATDTCKSLWVQLKTPSFPEKGAEMCQPGGKRQLQELFHGRREAYVTCHLSIFITICPFSMYPGMVSGLYTSHLQEHLLGQTQLY